VNGSSCDFTISRHYEPVATVSPGTCLRIQTELNIGDVLHSVDDEFDASMVQLRALAKRPEELAAHR
jgi:hypothetical protein